jgi:hypothetical protein
MKKISLLLVIAAIFLTSCNKYLDIVPDQVTKVEDLFATKTDAKDALAKIYSYLPVLDNINETPFLLGDEYVTTREGYSAAGKIVGQQIMRDLQSSNSPLLGIWEGTSGGKHYYVGMRHCDLVLEHVDLVFDMTEIEKKEMKAQVKFLKAYLAFMLIKQYGPIVIPQYLETDETDPVKLFPPRVSVDSSFNYVISLMKEAIPDLRVKVSIGDYGQVDQTVARSILARVMVYRASPFFNGNTNFFSTFRNIDGTHFFPQEYKKEKWKDAIDALQDAIAMCEANGISLYQYSEPTFYGFDSVFVRLNPRKAQHYYNRRFVVAEPWNTGLIWGRSDFFNYRTPVDDADGRNIILSNACNIILPDEGPGIYEGEGMTEKGYSVSCAQDLAASYQMVERYYTENGLPIDQDRTFPDANKYILTEIPTQNAPNYDRFVGLLQPGDTTVINLYVNREVRFYADLVITGGYARTHRYRIRTSMFHGKAGGRNSEKNTENYFCTGIGIQKMVHPESAAGQYFMQVRFPFPFIRFADLYLMMAEALNEYQDEPDGTVWEYVNAIRRMYGIPDVEESWGNGLWALTPNKHTTKLGMRDIILEERAIEFAFEGIHYWDMVRYNRATTVFSQPITGWNISGKDPDNFYHLRTIQYRRFPRASYLWPISVAEMNINSNLVNNPGWE